MAFGQIDPARLEGDALTRWCLRSPADIEEEKRQRLSRLTMPSSARAARRPPIRRLPATAAMHPRPISRRARGPKSGPIAGEATLALSIGRPLAKKTVPTTHQPRLSRPSSSLPIPRGGSALSSVPISWSGRSRRAQIEISGISTDA
jgi:hypothetical protein